MPPTDASSHWSSFSFDASTVKAYFAEMEGRLPGKRARTMLFIVSIGLAILGKVSSVSPYHSHLSFHFSISKYACTDSIGCKCSQASSVSSRKVSSKLSLQCLHVFRRMYVLVNEALKTKKCFSWTAMLSPSTY